MWITYSMNRSSSLEVNSSSASQQITRLLRNPRFITVFKRAHHWSLSWARFIQYTPSHLLPWDPFE